MLAVIEIGGKQYKVSEGLTLDIEKLDKNPKDKFIFEKVLLVSDGKKTEIGQPYLNTYEVAGTIVEQKKDKKQIVFKFKRKTGYTKKQGHRQQLTTIKIETIKLKSSKSTTTEESTKKPAKKTSTKTSTKTTAKKTATKKSAAKKTTTKKTTKKVEKK